MEKNKDKKPAVDPKKEIKEPFRPEDTPQPPQIMDASKEPEKDPKQSSTRNKPDEDSRD